MPDISKETQEMTWKVTVGGGVLIFLIGATFWAGAAYNRIDGIENQLREINTRMGTIGDIPIMKMEIEALKAQMKRQEDRDDSRRH